VLLHKYSLCYNGYVRSQTPAGLRHEETVGISCICTCCMGTRHYQVISLGIFVRNGSMFLLQAQEHFLNRLLLNYTIVLSILITC